jgi:hypothetical protein
MFEINFDFTVEEKIINGSPIYIIDNFYKDVDLVLELFSSVDPRIHKENEKPSFNQIHFDDRRHSFSSQKIIKVYDFLSNICGQKPNLNKNSVLTNCIRFKKNSFNDYQNNYWWPHIDFGYNGIVYLNKNDVESGTNLYESLTSNTEPLNYPEHYQPWKSKSNYKLIHTIKPKFNRLVLFDGLKFLHGMNICNDDYFGNKYRINQVFFFNP